MKRWTRSSNQYLAKTAKLSDSDMIHSSLGTDPASEHEVRDERFYRSLQEMKSAKTKSAVWIAVGGSLGVLAHFKAIESASASGLQISSAVFSHVSLLLLSVSTAYFCFSYSKQSYIQSWFSNRFKYSKLSQKVELLLRYPDAYWHFEFLPVNIGTPRFYLAERNLMWQIIPILLFLLIVILSAIGSLILWAAIAIDVWNSPGFSGLASGLVIVLSALVTLSGWTSPFFGTSSKKYKHTGLVELLSKIDEAKKAAAYRRIAQAAGSMGLLRN